MNTLFPFFQIAKIHGVKYARVLQLSDEILWRRAIGEYAPGKRMDAGVIFAETLDSSFGALTRDIITALA